MDRSARGRGYLTSSLSCTWMKRGRAKPTWASSGMATLYSELLNSGALSLMSMTRMLKVVVTVALEGVRSSFSSVPCKETKQQGSLYFSKNKRRSIFQRIYVKEGARAMIRDLQLLPPSTLPRKDAQSVLPLPLNLEHPSTPLTH